MTRINTNVSSLVARNTLGRSNAALEQSLTRLSTGLRINTGKDDPAGLIASENLRSDITSIKKAIGNTDRANQVIATADSALGQVSSLLNDIRGLVTESANNGALSDAQIAANQLQIDSSLEALNRIAQTTTFQGRKLLDGSLDFITSTTDVDFAKISALQIDQANLGATGTVPVSLTVTSAATKGQIDVANIPNTATPGTASTGNVEIEVITTPAVQATGTATLNTQATGNLTVTSQADGTLTVNSEATGTVTVAGETFNLIATHAGTASGAEGNAVANLSVTFGAGAASSTYNASTNTLFVEVTQTSGVADIQNVIDAVNAGTDFTATLGGANAATTVNTAQAAAATFSLTGGGQAIDLTALAGGDAEGVEGNQAANLAITFGAGAAATSYDAGTNTLSVSVTQVSGTATVQNIVDAINGGSDFAATAAVGTGRLSTGDAATAAFALTGGASTDITLAALAGGDAENAEGNQAANLAVTFGAGAAATSYDAGTNTLSVSVTQASGTATLQNIVDAINGGSDFSADVLPAQATRTISTGADATAAFALTGGSSNAIDLTAVAGGLADGLEGNGVANLAITYGAASAGSTYNATTNTLNVSVTQASGVAIINNVIDAVNAGTDFTAAVGAANGLQTLATGDDANTDFALANGADAITSTETIAVTGTTAAGANGNLNITIAEFAGVVSPTVVGNAQSGYTVRISNSGTTTVADIASAIASIDEVDTAVYAGSATYNAATDVPPTTASLTGGVDGSVAGLNEAVVFELSGSTGAEVLTFGEGTTLEQLLTGINLVKDATGVEATSDGTTLELISTGYGSDAIVDIRIISEGATATPTGVFSTSVGQRARDNGTDIIANVNGIAALGKGNSLSINTATLDLSTTLEAGFTGTIDFEIVGGGALFQLGPDVVSNQQARLGIASVNAARLGGISGKLYELGSGGRADLISDTTRGAEIVTEAIDQVTTLRGRLGAFQRTLLETNKNALGDTLVNLTEAESQIRDADFAEESAALTRAQILVQSGTTVLQIANSNPQNVLALLR